MIELGHGLVMTAPTRPGENVVRRVVHDQHKMPEEAANLGHTQSGERPRLLLKVFRLPVGPGTSALFFNTSPASEAARSAVRSA